MNVSKNMMRTAGLLLCSAALMMVPARAQDTAPPPPPPHGHQGGGPMMKMMASLDLTADQKTQIQAIMADKPTADPSDKKAMMQARKAQMQKVRAVLTPDQQAKFDAMMAQERANHANKGAGAGEAPPPPPPPPPAPPQN